MKKPAEKKAAEAQGAKTLPAALFLPKSKHDRRLANAVEAFERARARIRKAVANQHEAAEAARRALQDALDDEYLKTGVDPEAESSTRGARDASFVVASRPLERAYREAILARDRAQEAAMEEAENRAAIDRHRLVNLEYEVWVGEVCRLLKCAPSAIDWKKGTYEPSQTQAFEIPEELLAVAD